MGQFFVNFALFCSIFVDFTGKNTIILLYHSKVGDKEIIPLDLSHKQKLVKHSSLVMHTTHAALVLRTRCCMGGMHDLWFVWMHSSLASLVIRAFNFTRFCLWDASSGIISLSPPFSWYNSSIFYWELLVVYRLMKVMQCITGRPS